MRRAYALRRPVENRYLVRERDRRLLRELASVAAAVLVVGAALLVYTWIHLEMIATGYRIDGLERQHHRLQVKERQQRLEASYLAHPERIEERARSELGMRELRLEQTLFFQELAP